MRISLVLVLAAIGVAAVGAGCGSDKPTLTCSYLEGDNCWKTTLASASTCLPASTETGTLSADGKSCTYASGDIVTFITPVVLPLAGGTNMTWNFSVNTADGSPCLAYQDDGNGNITLTVQGQEVKQTAPGGLGIALTCPDGSSYSNPNAFALLSCPDANFFSLLPGATWSDSDTAINLSVTGADGAYGTLPVFDCQTAP